MSDLTRRSVLLGSTSRPFDATVLAGSGVAVATLAGVWTILPSLGGLLTFAAAAAVFTAPGWPLARWIVDAESDWPAVAALSLLLGYVCGTLVTCVLRLAHVSAPLAVLAACLIMAAVAHRLLPRAGGALLALPRATMGDRLAIAGLALVAIAIVAPVFAHVGAESPGGLAYRAYFTADLFAHMSIVAELAKGTTPPVNPYLASEPLPYYWGFFTLPTVFAQLKPSLWVDRGILLTDFFAAMVYVVTWYSMVRVLGASAIASVAGWFIALAGSWEGLFFLWRQHVRQRPLDAFRMVNIDAVTRWIWDLPPVDGLHRLFWYTPQHGAAVTLGLVMLAIVVTARQAPEHRRGAIEGLLFSGIFVFSSFNGLMLVAWYATTELVLVATSRARGLLAWIGGRVLAGAGVLVGVLMTAALEMVNRGQIGMLFKLDAHLMRGPWTFAILSFGPALVMGALGVIALRRARSLAIALTVLLGVSVAVLTFVEIPGHLNSYVPFRAGQLVLCVLAVASAYACDLLLRQRTAVRRIALATAGIAWLSGVPTLAMDWYNARDIANTTDTGFGFAWTSVISPDEERAIHWVIRNIDPTATVNTDPNARGRGEWAVIPALAGRRMGIGFGLFEPNPERFRPAMAQMERVFRAPTTPEAMATLRTFGIDYMFVGAAERARYGAAATDFDRRPDLYEQVYRNAHVAIYRAIK